MLAMARPLDTRGVSGSAVAFFVEGLARLKSRVHDLASKISILAAMVTYCARLGLLILALIFACTTPKGSSHKNLHANANALDVFIVKQMTERGIPGLQLAVIQHGRIVKLAAWGVANLEHNVPVTNDTIFPIKSATKAFVGVAIMQLVEAGKLKLDASIDTYLANLPAPWRALTLRSLLSHTSGLPDIVDENATLIVPDDLEASIAKTHTLPMMFPPGERFSHNQNGYMLLGQILDQHAGLPFAEFIKRRQLVPAMMPHTAAIGFVDALDVVPHHATTYRGNDDNVLGHGREELPAALRTAAGVESSAQEIATGCWRCNKANFCRPQRLHSCGPRPTYSTAKPAALAMYSTATLSVGQPWNEQPIGAAAPSAAGVLS